MALISTTHITVNPAPGDFVDLATPSSLSIGIMDISKAERNADGKMLIDRITTKQKLELEYEYLSRETLATVLTAVSYVKFSVKYTDPQTNTVRTGLFYCGDRSTGLLDFVNGVARYKSVKFNLIEY